MITNLVEGHVIAAYESLLPRFPGFCGCDICRPDVLVYALNRLPARYVASRSGSVITELDLDQHQGRATIDVVMMEGFRKVMQAPRCAKAPTAAL